MWSDSGGPASHAGNQYHFTYVARRMLHMLLDDTLVMIVIEGVSPSELQASSDPAAFLSVDISEYYGSEDPQTASRLVITQVKYSSSAPSQSWTLRRLVKDEGAKKRTSVVGRLGKTFDFYGQLLSNDVSKIELQIRTNQPLNKQLEVILQIIRDEINATSSQDAERWLQRVSDPKLRSVIDDLKKATGLSWPRFLLFLKCWELSGFAQPSLDDEIDRLYEDVHQLRAKDAAQYADLLRQYANDKARSRKDHRIYRRDVYLALKTRPEDFRPAPYNKPEILGLQSTAYVQGLIEHIEKIGNGFVVLHGAGGTGKSITLAQFASVYGENRFPVVIYDCWAGGEGIKLHKWRYQLNKFIAQVVNELADVYQTDIWANRQDTPEILRDRLEIALSIGSQKAGLLNQRLVIVVDAIDNAFRAFEIAKGETPDPDPSFMSLLSDLDLPDNCVFLISSRTENLGSIVLSQKPTLYEITGFSHENTLRYLYDRLGLEDESIGTRIHERTNGIPRILDNLAKQVVKDDLHDLTEIIEKLSPTLTEYYSTSCDSIFGNSDFGRLLLGTLLEVEKPTIEIIADMWDVTPTDIGTLVDRLYYGIRLTESGHLEFADQDFFDFVGDYSRESQPVIRQHLSKYCLQNYHRSAYALGAFARHLYVAQQHNELVTTLLGDALEMRLRILSPYEEDVLPDIQLGLFSALETKRFGEAMQLLSIAASIKHGSDVFLKHITKYVGLAVEFGDLARLERYLEALPVSPESARAHLALAANLAQRPGSEEPAHNHFQLSTSIITYIIEQEQPERHSFFSLEDVQQRIMYGYYTSGFTESVHNLRSFKPQPTLAPVYVELGKTIADSVETSESVLAELSNLDPVSRACLTIGLIIGGVTLNIEDSAYSEIGAVLKREEKVRAALHDIIYDLAISLIRRQAPSSTIQDILSFWEPRPPTDSYSPIETGNVMIQFLRKRAVLHTIGQAEFDPSQYMFPEETKSSASRDIDKVRKHMAQYYPAILAYIKALMNPSDTSVIQDIDNSLKGWLEELEDPWYAPNWRFSLYCLEALKALTELDGPQHEAISHLLETTKRMYPVFIQRLGEMVQVLLNHSDYQGFAEELIDKHVNAIIELTEPATERVEMLLEMCALCRQIDQDHAAAIYRQAREVAATIDERMVEMVQTVLATAKQVQKGKMRLSSTQVQAILSIAPQLVDLADDGMGPLVPDLVAVVAPTNITGALSALRGLRSRRFSESSGITAIAQILLDNRIVDPEYIWPLIFLDARGAWQLVKESAAQFKETHNREGTNKALNAWWGMIQRDYYQSRLNRAKDFLYWVQQQKVAFPIHQVAELVTGLQQIGLDQDDHTFSSYSQDGVVPFEEKIKELKHDGPQALLDYIRGTSIKQHLQSYSSTPFFRLIQDNVLPYLTAQQKAELSKWVASDTWEFHAYYALSFVVDIADQTHSNYTALQQVLEQVKTVVFDNIDSLTRTITYYIDGLPTLFNALHIESDFCLQISLGAAAGKLNSLNSNQIYGLLSQAVTRLSQDDSSKLLDRLMQRYSSLGQVDRIVNNTEPEVLLVDGLCDRLGDPDIQLVWQVAYALIEIALQKPTITIPLLLDRANNVAHKRWMSIREWILFIIQHLSLKEPSILLPYVDRVLEHAINQDFPHALIREYAKQTIVNLGNAYPQKVTASVVNSAKDVNKAKNRLMPTNNHWEGVAYQGRRWERRYDDNEEPFHFDSMDTMPYWYAPLAHRFGLHRCHVADRARTWVVERWNVTDQECRHDLKESRSIFGEQELYGMHHGGYGRIMTLRTYVEHHALYLVAGQMIDTLPAYQEDDIFETWDSWASDHLSLIDPSLPSYYLSCPPAHPESYGIFPSDFNKWMQIDPIEIEQELIGKHLHDNFIVLNSRNSVNLKGHYATTEVASYLVPVATVNALGRLVQAEQNFGELYSLWPEGSDSRSLHPTHFSDIDQHIAMSKVEVDENDHSRDERFVIAPFYSSFYSGASLDTHDPLWPDSSRVFALPPYDFIEKMGLQRAPMGLEYRDSAGQVIAQGQVWHQTYGSSEYVTGRRLVARQESIEQYLGKGNLALLIVVHMRREESYEQRRRGEQEMAEAVRSFILSVDGLLPC